MTEKELKKIKDCLQVLKNDTDFGFDGIQWDVNDQDNWDSMNLVIMDIARILKIELEDK